MGAALLLMSWFSTRAGQPDEPGLSYYTYAIVTALGALHVHIDPMAANLHEQLERAPRSQRRPALESLSRSRSFPDGQSIAKLLDL